MRIDGIDLQIQALIAERARWAQQVGKAKGPLKAAVDYYRPERESQVLRQVLDRNDGPLSDEVLLRLFREIMSACLAQQEPLKVGYLGPEGTFSQQALHKHFGHSANGLPLASIEEVFQEVEAGNADFGVVPVENSGQGTIQSTLDMFLTSPLKICGEVELRVHQHLMSRTGRLEDIERVYSHPMSLAQCKAWLRQHLPKAEKIPVASNAEAARRARTADDAAAIAGESAGHVYGLKVVAGPIQDRQDNTTRFLVLGRELFSPSGHDRTSLLVYVRDQPGALYNVLSPFAQPRRQHEPHRIAAFARRALAVRLLHRRQRPRGRRRGGPRPVGTGRVRRRREGARLLSGGPALMPWKRPDFVALAQPGIRALRAYDPGPRPGGPAPCRHRRRAGRAGLERK